MKKGMNSKLVNELQRYHENTVILDTETTGLANDDEVIEIAVIDTQGSVLLNTLVKPTKPMSANNEASRIHGITNTDLSNAPSWCEVQEQLLNVISGKHVLIYNAAFDTRLMNQTAYLNDYYEVEYSRAVCLMKLYSQWFARFHGGDIKTRHKLVDAAAFCGVAVKNAHRALDDCLISLGVLQYMQSNCEEIQNYTERTQRIKTEANPNGHLYGETVVITGDLSLPRAEIQQLAADAGCRCTASVSPKTTILVLGEANLSAIKGTMSSKEQRARELQAQGNPIRILTEQEFMTLLNQ